MIWLSSRAALTAFKISGAPGVSECTHTVSAVMGTRPPSKEGISPWVIRLTTRSPKTTALYTHLTKTAYESGFQAVNALMHDLPVQ